MASLLGTDELPATRLPHSPSGPTSQSYSFYLGCTACWYLSRSSRGPAPTKQWAGGEGKTWRGGAESRLSWLHSFQLPAQPTLPTHSLYPLYTESTLTLHTVYTHSTHSLHLLYTQSTPAVHTIYTQSTPALYTVYTCSRLTLHQCPNTLSSDLVCILSPQGTTSSSLWCLKTGLALLRLLKSIFHCREN